MGAVGRARNIFHPIGMTRGLHVGLMSFDPDIRDECGSLPED